MGSGDGAARDGKASEDESDSTSGTGDGHVNLTGLDRLVKAYLKEREQQQQGGVDAGSLKPESSVLSTQSL